ncbi:hypothetical protein GW17_00004728 [Ensete ventricosum]|nr:hypothetical protein GW17_00004728 [Ensete ventricosum]
MIHNCLMQLLSGGINDFDVDDLRSNTKYSGGYSETSRTVKLFWEVLIYCSRAPLLGFKHLQPAFTIHKFQLVSNLYVQVACDLPLWATLGGQDVDRLPSASTCYNTLKVNDKMYLRYIIPQVAIAIFEVKQLLLIWQLPTYKRSSTLRNKLLYAISSNTGFELS